MNNQQSLGGGAHGFIPLKGRNVWVGSPTVRKIAFTLAEVLVTLGIIGIVAALTMPTLIENHRKKETAVKVKKAYSILSQAFQRSIADNGDPINWEFKNGDVSGGAQEAGDKYIAPYLNIVKKCGNDNTDVCETKIEYLNKVKVTNYYSANYAKYFLNDGSMIVVAPKVYTTNDNFPAHAVRVYVDINGSKKPNMWGKDFFYFAYVRSDDPIYADINGKFLPAGARFSEHELLTQDDDDSCHKNKAGWACAALIMKQNWEITNDYPW